MEIIQSQSITVESRIYNQNNDILIPYCELYNFIFRKLFNEIRNNPDSEFKILQQQYSKEFNIKVRVFKSLYIKVQAALASLKELNKQYISEKESKINETTKKYNRSKYKGKKHYLGNKLNNLKQQLFNLENKKDWNITFGTKKLYKSQWSKKKSINYDAWIKEWRRERNNNLYFVGSKDESYGNSLCQLISLTQLRLTLPEEIQLLNNNGNKYLILDINLDHNGKNYDLLKTAISNNQALTYNISQKENGKWYINVSFEISTHLNPDNYNGTIGIDLNHNLIATCTVKKDGNQSEFKDYIMDIENWSSDRITNELSLILDDIVKRAKEENKSITIEDLNFTKKKSKDNGSITNKKLHLLPFSKFYKLLLSKCIKNNLLLKLVNPAYTSVISKFKYKNQFGRSVHSCAAYVIGRRGLGYTERIPYGIRSLLHSGGNLVIDKHETWKSVFKQLIKRYPIFKERGFSLRNTKSEVLQLLIVRCKPSVLRPPNAAKAAQEKTIALSDFIVV